MSCFTCKEFWKGKSGAGGFGRDAWLKGCTRLRIEVVTEHEKSKMHRDANAARQTKQTIDRRGMFAAQFARRDEAALMAMKLLFWVVKENVALEKWNSLKTLLENLGVDAVTRLNLARNATYSSRHARDDMLLALYSVVEEQTKSVLSDATFSCVLSDETTDVANLGQVVIHFRCVKSGVVETRFGGASSVDERNAEAIQKALEAKADEWGLDWRKCHLGSDGASVFTGRHNGVHARLIRRHDMQHSIAVHCICHREALAAADAIKAVPYLETTVAPTLGGVFRHFNNSSVKEASLHEFQEALDMPVLCLKEPKDVRWLSYDLAVTAFRKSYRAIVLELQFEASQRHDPAAKGLLKKVRTQLFTKQFIALPHFTTDIMRLEDNYDSSKACNVLFVFRFTFNELPFFCHLTFLLVPG